MRMTKRELKRIIREEYSRIQNEGLLKENYLSENDGEYEYVMGIADQAYQDGVRRFGDFWKMVWPDLRAEKYDRRDAQTTCRKIWKFIKDDYRPRSKYDNWSAWD